MFFRKKETDLRNYNSTAQNEPQGPLDHDPDYEFYGIGPKRYNMLMYILTLLNSEEGDSLCEELQEMGSLLEADEEKHLPELLAFQQKAFSEIREYFPTPSPMDFKTENERLSDVLLRFEYRYAIARVSDQEEDAQNIIESARAFMGRLSYDFDETIESQEQSLDTYEDLFMHDVDETRSEEL